jgi:hypothetical protein
MNCYYVTPELAGTWKWPKELGWYYMDEDQKLYGPASMIEEAEQMFVKATGRKLPEPK